MMWCCRSISLSISSYKYRQQRLRHLRDTNCEMKAIALTTLLTLCVAAKAYTFVDYHLKCSQEEVGIRWPSYYSNSDYYVCQGVGGKQLKMSCTSGEVFTFVLQMCTTPSKFIPPPPLDVLPTSASAVAQPYPIDPILNFPKPFHPGHIGPQTPPITIDGQPPIIEKPIIKPPYFELPYPLPEVLPESEPAPEQENPVEPPNKPSMPSLPGIKPPTKPVPIPPTPAPTPPVMKPPSPPSAPRPNGLKLPTSNNKKPTPPVATGKKNVPKPPPAPVATGKKSVPKPPAAPRPPSPPKI